jgi:2-C-methyl-D-erythritol 4-phosphate cytidylyltransferase
VNCAIIVAAGKGVRMGAGTDKLFLEVAGRPVIAHTWARFDASPSIDSLVVVVRDERQELFAGLAAKYAFCKPFKIVAGGAERQDSVWLGLAAAPPATELVAIQDGARPCTAERIIMETLAAARTVGAAVAACRITDTVKESQDQAHISRHLDRSRLWAVQTPQCFRIEVIRHALTAVREKRLVVTDDTAACEYIGAPVRLVESSSPNPKVTVPEDLPYIEQLLRSRVL